MSTDNERILLDEIERKDAAIELLTTRMTELQALGTKHVLERQAMNRYGSRNQRQRLVLRWATRVFGTITTRIEERAMRVVEEAIEVAQAAGISQNTVEKILYRIYGKEPGRIEEEMGGLLVTTLAMCEVLGAEADELERNEIERILALPEGRVQEKHETKRALGIAL